MFYHYCSINNKERYMQNNLKNGCLHFSDVNEFNDASEFSYTIKNDPSQISNEDAKKIKFVYDYLNKDMLDSGKRVPLGAYSAYNNFDLMLERKEGLRGNNESVQALMFVFTEYIIEGLRSLCFTKNKRSIPMWGYYGDGMKGVCLGFDIDESSLIKVKYYKENERIPEVNVDNIVNFGKADSFEYAKRIVSCKSVGWEHEQEFRWINHIKQLDELSNIEIDKKNLKEIVFGSKCDVDKVSEIIDIVLADVEYFNVEFKIAVVNDSKYCIDTYKVEAGRVIQCLKALQDKDYKFVVASYNIGTYMDALGIGGFDKEFIFQNN